MHILLLFTHFYTETIQRLHIKTSPVTPVHWI